VIIALYARGMITREIRACERERYGILSTLDSVSASQA
jgi:transposase-like protein